MLSTLHGCQHVLKSLWLSDPEHNQLEGPNYWDNTDFTSLVWIWNFRAVINSASLLPLGITGLMPHVTFWGSQCKELPGINLWVSLENHTIPLAHILPQQSLFLSLLWIPRQGTAAAASIKKVFLQSHILFGIPVTCDQDIWTNVSTQVCLTPFLLTKWTIPAGLSKVLEGHQGLRVA